MGLLSGFKELQRLSVDIQPLERSKINIVHALTDITSFAES